MTYAPPRSHSNTTTSESKARVFESTESSPLTIEPTPDPWVDYAHHRIKLAYALEDNWDLEGAVEVPWESVQLARTLAVQLVDLGVDRPFVVPSQEGAICFEWLTPASEVTIEVEDDRVTGYILDRQSREETRGDLNEIWASVYEALTT